MKKVGFKLSWKEATKASWLHIVAVLLFYNKSQLKIKSNLFWPIWRYVCYPKKMRKGTHVEIQNDIQNMFHFYDSLYSLCTSPSLLAVWAKPSHTVCQVVACTTQNTEGAEEEEMECVNIIQCIQVCKYKTVVQINIKLVISYLYSWNSKLAILLTNFTFWYFE